MLGVGGMGEDRSAATLQISQQVFGAALARARRMDAVLTDKLPSKNTARTRHSEVRSTFWEHISLCVCPYLPSCPIGPGHCRIGCLRSLRVDDIRFSMARRPKRVLQSYLWPAGMLLLTLSACRSPGEWARLHERREVLQRENARLERVVAQRDGTVARLHQQIDNLKSFGPDQPADLFAPVKLEIASLSGGADYDGKSGDDGITVYLRPRDADGDVVKVPGRITVQLLDNTNLASPRVLGVYVFDDPKKLRRLWHGRFATNHYTLRCPFPPGLKLPDDRRITVSAEFVEYLTGATLTSVKEVTVSYPDE